MSASLRWLYPFFFGGGEGGGGGRGEGGNGVKEMNILSERILFFFFKDSPCEKRDPVFLLINAVKSGNLFHSKI